MRAPFVADASAAIAWIHPAQATEETLAWLESVRAGAVLHVPALWHLEVANALLALTRRGKLSEEQRQRGLGWLRQLPCVTDHEATDLAFGRLSELASRQGLSVYDAAYLELAGRLSLPLASKDEALRRAAAQL